MPIQPALQHRPGAPRIQRGHGLGCWLRHGAAIGLAAGLSASGAPAAQARTGEPVAALRDAEAGSCLRGELRTWPDGQDRAVVRRPIVLLYRHAGAPPAFDEATVLAVVQRAARAWSTCGIAAEVQGEATAQLDGPPVVVQWNEAATRGNFALADVGRRTLSLSAGLFRLLAQRNPRHPAVQTLQMALSHELGHFYGLMAHSRRCVDVMSYYTSPDGAPGPVCSTRDGGSYRRLPEYRALLPTACDIERCKAVNDLPR
jgi:hypothetical protein